MSGNPGCPGILWLHSLLPLWLFLSRASGREVMEELGISMEELQDIIDKELEKFECVKQRKQQLEELEKCVKQKEEEVARVDRLFDDASRWVRSESQPWVRVRPQGRGGGDGVAESDVLSPPRCPSV
uniref:Uncharacterized protein n=1 Tax=Bubo bubo TaxID=30461 RepID=A0A8C0IIR9_BUBBB